MEDGVVETKRRQQEEVSHHNFQTPFPPNSVNILVASTNSGKTTLAFEIIKNQQYFFKRKVNKIVLVLCNPLIDNSEFFLDDIDPDLKELIVVKSIDEFDIESDLEAGTFLIFDDVQTVNRKILDCVNLFAHHADLESVFIICQGLLGSKDLFPLVSLTHRIVLFFSAAGATRLSRFIISSFFQDPELKEYLRGIVARAEKNKSVLLLDVNQLNGVNKPKFLAIDGLDHLAEGRPAIVYPHLNEKNNYKKMKYDEYEAELSGDSNDNDDNVGEDGNNHVDVPEGSYVLVPAANVKRKKKKGKFDATMSSSSSSDQNPSYAKKVWDEMVHAIEQDIIRSVRVDKRSEAFNVAVAILKTKQFTVNPDGRSMAIVGLPKSRIPVLDFVMTAIRKSGPNEIADDNYVDYMRILLDNHTPRNFFKNKLLVKTAADELDSHDDDDDAEAAASAGISYKRKRTNLNRISFNSRNYGKVRGLSTKQRKRRKKMLQFVNS